MAAVTKMICVALLIGLAFWLRSQIQQSLGANAAAQPSKARALRVEARVVDVILVIGVALVSLGILGA